MLDRNLYQTYASLKDNPQKSTTLPFNLLVLTAYGLPYEVRPDDTEQQIITRMGHTLDKEMEVLSDRNTDENSFDYIDEYENLPKNNDIITLVKKINYWIKLMIRMRERLVG